MFRIITLLLMSFLLFSCKKEKIDHNLIVIKIKENNKTMTVDIPEYFLITDSLNPRIKAASEILETKRKWPLAMQSLKKQAFEDILTKDFIFVDNGKIIQREAYIKDRTTPSDWKITHVIYDNMTLQFFDDSAILGYRNHITNENSITKEIEKEDICWVDVYRKESGKWKIVSAHVVDFKMTRVEKNK